MSVLEINHSAKSSSFYLSDADLKEDGNFFKFYYTIFPLWYLLQDFFEEEDRNVKENFFKDCIFYDDNNMYKGLVYSRLMRYKEAENNFAKFLEINKDIDPTGIHLVHSKPVQDSEIILNVNNKAVLLSLVMFARSAAKNGTLAEASGICKEIEDVAGVGLRSAKSLIKECLQVVEQEKIQRYVLTLAPELLI